MKLDDDWDDDDRHDASGDWGDGDGDDYSDPRPMFGCACQDPLVIDTCCRACIAYMAREYAEGMREQADAAEAEARRAEREASK